MDGFLTFVSNALLWCRGSVGEGFNQNHKNNNFCYNHPNIRNAASNKTRCALQLKNEVVMHDGNSNRMHVWDTVWNHYVDPSVLFYETQTRDTSIHPVTVYMTNHCTRRLRLYHEFYHYKYHLINDVRRYMSSQMNDWDTFIQGKRMEHQDLIARIVKAGKTYNTSRDQFI